MLNDVWNQGGLQLSPELALFVLECTTNSLVCRLCLQSVWSLLRLCLQRAQWGFLNWGENSLPCRQVSDCHTGDAAFQILPLSCLPGSVATLPFMMKMTPSSLNSYSRQNMSSTPPTGMTSLTLVSLGSWWAALGRYTLTWPDRTLCTWAWLAKWRTGGPNQVMGQRLTPLPNPSLALTGAPRSETILANIYWVLTVSCALKLCTCAPSLNPQDNLSDGIAINPFDRWGDWGPEGEIICLKSHR